MTGLPRARDGSALRVVVGEDNLIAREGVVRVLSAFDDIEVVAACADLDGLREAIDRLRPDVVLTDLRMPPTQTDEGIRLAQELRETQPGVGVVVLSQYDEPEYALALFDRGADSRGYLLKDTLTDGEALRRALHEIAAGGTTIDPRIVGNLLDRRAGGEDPLFAELTTREREVLRLIAEGRSNGSIAAELAITRRGIERHIGSIFRKLELTEARDVDRRVKAALIYLAEAER